MKKSTLAVALGLVMGAASVGANAALVNGSTLSINAGSCFNMGGGTVCPPASPALSGQNILGNNGLVLGTIQAASGSHGGAPNGTVAVARRALHRSLPPRPPARSVE